MSSTFCPVHAGLSSGPQHNEPLGEVVEKSKCTNMENVGLEKKKDTLEQSFFFTAFSENKTREQNRAEACYNQNIVLPSSKIFSASSGFLL